MYKELILGTYTQICIFFNPNGGILYTQSGTSLFSLGLSLWWLVTGSYRAALFCRMPFVCDAQVIHPVLMGFRKFPVFCGYKEGGGEHTVRQSSFTGVFIAVLIQSLSLQSAV